MKIIYLNCYSGQLKKPLLEFVQNHSIDTDIFCFQEVSVSLHKELVSILNGYSNVFEIGFMLSDCNEEAGQAIFYRNNIKFSESEKVLLHELKTKDIGFFLKAKFNLNDRDILIGNMHGTAQPSNELDTEIRVEQSQIVLDSIKNEKITQIIGGDFNLLRNTKSIQMFEEFRYKNLIKEFDIKATRNRVAWERFKNDPNFVKQYDSDYIFVTNDVSTKSLKVPDVEISDHLPLILEFEV